MSKFFFCVYSIIRFSGKYFETYARLPNIYTEKIALQYCDRTASSLLKSLVQRTQISIKFLNILA